MFGKFQQSLLRIELEADKSLIRDALTQKDLLKKWLPVHYLTANLPERLAVGNTFNTFSLTQKVESIDESGLCLILSGAIDGYQQWSWGDGWVQSKLEGVSLLPLNLAGTATLVSLREFVKAQSGKNA
jgi:hypothetical protein